ncbi:MAG TPA: DUF4126 domain-containing protein [Jiangellales bacterium]|nr:DUF4126 domain-containing protein [Jiangellales bacterium]
MGSRVESFAYALSGGWASGISAYATVLVLGLAGRAGLADTPDLIQRTDVIIVMAVFTAIEFVADKIPYADSLWDTVHTVVRPIVAAVLGWVFVNDGNSAEQFATAAVAGGTALLSHTGKAGIRLAINTSPEPASNVAMSTAEDAMLLGVLLLATQYPWLAAGTALAVLVVMLAAVTVIARRARRGWRRLRDRYFPDPREDTG